MGKSIRAGDFVKLKQSYTGSKVLARGTVGRVAAVDRRHRELTIETAKGDRFVGVQPAHCEPLGGFPAFSDSAWWARLDAEGVTIVRL